MFTTITTSLTFVLETVQASCNLHLYLDRTLIVMANIEEHSMCYAWNQRPQVGLEKGTKGFSAKTMHQPAFFVTVPSTHCLWSKTQSKSEESSCQLIN